MTRINVELDDISGIIQYVRGKRSAVGIDSIVRSTGIGVATVRSIIPLFPSLHRKAEGTIMCVGKYYDVLKPIPDYSCEKCPLRNNDVCIAGQVVNLAKRKVSSSENGYGFGPFRYGKVPRRSANP